jgi:hypothetical protein
MGYRTSTIGHMDVRPALNDAEFGYLTGLAETRRWRRPEGELFVPMSPFGFDEEAVVVPTEAYNDTGRQPGLWCPWIPSCRGECLVVNEDGTDGKNYGIAAWLDYLMKTFLEPGARAEGEPGFDEFTFDHEVSGVIATHGLNDGAFSLLRAGGGDVWTEVVRRGDPAPWD